MMKEEYSSELIASLTEKGKLLRRDCIKCIGIGVAGHVGGSCSSADMVAALYFHKMKVDPKNPEWEDRDYFLLSKGHVAILQYAALYLRKYMPAEHRRAAPAAGAAGVDILFFAVEDHHSAVVIAFTEIYTVLHEKITQHPSADISQIAGQYKVVIFGRRTGILKVSLYRVIRRGSHCRAHIVGILDAHVDYRAYRHRLHIRRR